jgi:hypothetical protein
MQPPRTARKASDRLPQTLEVTHSEATRHLCTLCGATFRSRNRYKLYCQHCRGDNEVLRFSEWLPAISDSMSDSDFDLAA